MHACRDATHGALDRRGQVCRPVAAPLQSRHQQHGQQGAERDVRAARHDARRILGEPVDGLAQSPEHDNERCAGPVEENCPGVMGGRGRHDGFRIYRRYGDQSIELQSK